MGIWILTLAISVPAFLFGYWRYRWMRRRGQNRQAAVLMGFFLTFLFIGVLRRHEVIRLWHQDDPQAFRFSANPLIRILFTPEAASIAVTDEAAQQEVFTYFRNDGAARLTALEHPAPQEWRATFSLNVSEARNAKLEGYFEEEVTERVPALPTTRVYRAWGGVLRVVDSQSGLTLFRYLEDSSVRPIEAGKTATASGVYEWKVKFATAASLPPQAGKNQEVVHVLVEQ
ncbi:MAG: hypothetical protein HOP19_06250 [Acidobacteria bacterium]|nr:hypothetical protein [Acidobacteriota bacterium]